MDQIIKLYYDKGWNDKAGLKECDVPNGIELTAYRLGKEDGSNAYKRELKDVVKEIIK